MKIPSGGTDETAKTRFRQFWQFTGRGFPEISASTFTPIEQTQSKIYIP
jgi:hypothetical protein